MKAQRVAIFAVGAIIATAMPGASALAQQSDAAVLSIMRECAKVQDPTSRLACYDNNIRAGSQGRPVVPGANGRVSGGGAVFGDGSGPQGFGAESIAGPERFQSYSERTGGLDELSAKVTAVREREPNVYLVTLEGGAQWLFTESAGQAFRVPRPGDTVEISRAALGSFLMRFDNQVSIRVRRIK